MKILIVAASLRQDSYNKKLAALIAQEIGKSHAMELLDFKNLTAPLYDGDIEANQGAPQETLALAAKLRESQALIIVSPEYNFGIPGTLKNVIDWISRVKPMPLANLPIMLASASPALAGGHRGLLQLMIALNACNAIVFPKMFTLAQADQAFNKDGALQNQDLATLLQKNSAEFLRFADKNKIKN